jgi:hypothetical protein
MDKQKEIEFQLERREQLIRHIAFLYMTGRPVKSQILDTEQEIELVEKRLEWLGYVRN